ncbi:cellulase signal transduction associated dehydrogenase [Coniochaeta sp. 2T2.1]|nr:cellulase signal transduction associated dehydrogenase [Coniochaeta sp. 2T2.1]
MPFTTKPHTTTYPLISSFSLPPSTTTVLITGAGSGIGRATSLSHARAGAAHLVLLGRRTEPLEATASLIASSHPAVSVSVHAVDILSTKDLGEVFGRHRIDTVVHCAGDLLPLKPIVEQDPEQLWGTFEVNVRGALNVALAFLRSLQGDDQEERKGTVVALNSAGVFMGPFPGVGGYLSGKLAAMKMLDCLAAESQGRLRVTHVHPGAVRTGMAEEFERAGVLFVYDDVSLPADFLVWVGSQEAAWLGGRYVFANWDVDELVARRGEIEEGTELTVGLRGVPGV